MIKRIINTFRLLISNNTFVARWYRNKENWGDVITPEIIRRLYRVKIFHNSEVFVLNNKLYSLIGSIINVFPHNKNIVIWGSGVANPEKKMSYKPKNIFAVRGPLTKKYLEQNNINCPEIYGDPVLLIDRVYTPKSIKKKYKYGIILHYEDQLKIHNQINDILYIDIIRDMSYPFSIIDEIVSCENIISSSLHGLILADVYNVPNRWVFIKNNIKGEYKFQDYYQSIQDFDESPLLLDSEVRMDEISNIIFKSHDLNIDKDALYNSSPFLNR